MILKRAFTIAEVLITLGIIGIVAQMTIPTLTKNVETQIYKAGLKKSFSILSQAYLSLRSDNGGSISGLCSTNDSDCLGNLFKTYVKSTFQVSGVPNTTNLPGCWNNNQTAFPTEPKMCILTNDGMAVNFDMEWDNCVWRCGVIDVDVNGLKNPNIWGKDRYRFTLFDGRLTANTDFPCDYGVGDWTNNQSCSYNYLYTDP